MKIFKSLLLSLAVVASSTALANGNFVDYVNPLIGSGGHGHVFVGASVPFGFVQLGPTSVTQEWDWTSGYHQSENSVIGFSHTHLSGTGIGDLFDVTLMPVVGKVKYDRGRLSDETSGLWSYSDRSREVVRPGYYSTHLTRYNVDVELTSTSRVGLHKYSFPETTEAAVVIDLENGGCWDRATASDVRQLDDYTVEGYRYSTGWATDQRIYFVAKFSKKIKNFEIYRGENAGGNGGVAVKTYARIDLEPNPGTVLVKVALSPTSCANARLNLDTEMPDWDFAAVENAAVEKWNEALGRIDIEAADDVKTKFYTSLYHTMIAPSEFCDVNGDYYGADHRNHFGDGHVNYTTFSCWDTYRAAHPLMTLIHPERQADILATFARICEQGGVLPVWHLMGCETYCMVGNPGVCIFADGITKGYAPADEHNWSLLDHSSMTDDRGQNLRKKYGYIPCDSMDQSVSYELEYALADWAVAQVAKKMGKTDKFDYYMKRSESYKPHFDKNTGFVRGVRLDGTFREGFNPYYSDHFHSDFMEGNSWQYSFLVPHDVDGLVACMGGKKRFVQKLDSLFTVKSELEGENASPDISGMIGQYAHGNEPSHHTIYLYSMIGERAKAAPLLRKVMKELYTTEPDGLSGNEDVGQMSAWYVLSAVGIYQVEPAGGRYFFGSPVVDKAVIKVRDGKFAVTVHDNSDKNMYIKRVTLNGKPYTKSWIDFEDIAKGGTLDIFMTNKKK